MKLKNEGRDVDIKGKDLLSGVELKNLMKKEAPPPAPKPNSKKQIEEEPEDLERADRVEGLGHSKKDHINSGIYSGLDLVATKE